MAVTYRASAAPGKCIRVPMSRMMRPKGMDEQTRKLLLPAPLYLLAAQDKMARLPHNNNHMQSQNNSDDELFPVIHVPGRVEEAFTMIGILFILEHRIMYRKPTTSKQRETCRAHLSKLKSAPYKLQGMKSLALPGVDKVAITTPP